MSTFESKTFIKSPLSRVYRFLADFNNHQQLMPDNIQNWTSTNDEASFGIQNMVQLSLQIESRVENKSVNIVAVGTPPFGINLNWDLATEGDGTAVTFTINAELNMMMKMMTSGPLQKLADHEVEALKNALEQ
ncbi:SRPBCC family protein [Mucilaginibacter sp. UR6-11]|uniref:SRPBCC family protein n=1 Tax=Mucilaginibacter sp. UR6-11 TaxID=1435644 RepID=UPI001E58857A|nr:SRPBCC family protein [Mucilaginibacter sp. UR6-11]MCC8426014.1 SRPBCC family protein [Mucilaginibacter sp. UR6-11]